MKCILLFDSVLYLTHRRHALNKFPTFFIPEWIIRNVVNAVLKIFISNSWSHVTRSPIELETKMEETSKRSRGRPKLSETERKRRIKERLKLTRKCKVYLGKEHKRWLLIKYNHQLRSDREVARLLLDMFVDFTILRVSSANFTITNHHKLNELSCHKDGFSHLYNLTLNPQKQSNSFLRLDTFWNYCYFVTHQLVKDLTLMFVVFAARSV